MQHRPVEMVSPNRRGHRDGGLSAQGDTQVLQRQPSVSQNDGYGHHVGYRLGADLKEQQFSTLIYLLVNG